VTGSTDREERLFQVAVLAFEAGDLDMARTLFQQVVDLDGQRRTDAERYLALIWKQAGRAGTPSDKRDNAIENSIVIGGGDSAPPPPQSDTDVTKGNRGEQVVRPRRDRDLSMTVPMEHPLPMAPANLYVDPGCVPDTPDKPGLGVIQSAEPEDESASAPVPIAPEILRRTPHMDLDPPPPAAVAARIQVSVYTDTGLHREGEDGEDVSVELPPGQDHVDLNVWLVVEAPFSIEGPDSRKLTLHCDRERSEPALFTVVRTGVGPAPTALFSALFAFKGRPCGRVSRAVAVVAAGAADTPPAVHLEPTVRVETAARPADLYVRIVASSTDGRTFQCNVQTPLIAAYRDGVTEEWGLKSLAAEVVRQQMDQFVKAIDNWSRTVALRAAGMKLFEAAPRIFQKVFWELIDSGNLPETISIVTEEPSLPWELMVPNRRLPSGKVQKLDPLGVTFLVSRWTSQQHVLPAQRLLLSDAYVIAPRDSKLGAAEDEAALVLGQFHGERIDPASPRTLDQKLEQHGPALLHFVCHGRSGDVGCQMLLLDQKQVLRADSLSGMEGVEKGLGAGKPLVFLNACEVGRQELALVGTGGFAEEFMALGASAVIAPLWSVKDSIAHEIAVEFYRRIKAEPATPFAAILRDLRTKSYAAEGGEDTYAAYCFYGDPLATAG